MKIRLPKTRRFRVYIYILCTLLVLYAIDLVWVRYERMIHIGYDTTRITGPLAPDGTIDYLRALDEKYGAGITPENNAAPLLITALGPGILPKDANAIYTRLGMRPLPEKGDYYLPAPAYKGHDPSMADDFDPWVDELAYFSPTRGSGDPDFSAWLQSNAHPLELLYAAVQRPRYYMPPTRDDPEEFTSSHISYITVLPRLADTRAIARLDQNNFSGSREDLLAAFHCARLVGQGFSITERLVALHMEEDAFRAIGVLVDSEKLSARQARQLLVDTTALPPPPPVSDTIDACERFGTLNSLIRLSHESNDKLFRRFHETQFPDDFVMAFPRRVMNFVPINFNDALRRANQFFDDYVAAAQAPTFSRQDAQFHAVEERIESLVPDSGSSNVYTLHPSDLILSYALTSYGRVTYLYQVYQTRLDLTRVALALAAFHADHQQYPATLLALIPDYLPKTPLDSFNDQPLHYALNPPGERLGYLLYSVGSNQKDDGGFGSGRYRRDKNNADDIVIHIPRLPMHVPATSPATRPH